MPVHVFAFAVLLVLSPSVSGHSDAAAQERLDRRLERYRPGTHYTPFTPRERFNPGNRILKPTGPPRSATGPRGPSGQLPPGYQRFMCSTSYAPPGRSTLCRADSSAALGSQCRCRHETRRMDRWGGARVVVQFFTGTVVSAPTGAPRAMMGERR